MALLRCFHRFLHPPANHRHCLTRSLSFSDVHSCSCLGRRGIATRASSSTIASILARHFPGSESHSPTNKNNESSLILLNFVRLMSTQGKVSPQQLRQGSLKITMLSPGFIFEPYKPREPFPFWKRWFTPSGWRRTKADIIMELKNSYAIAHLRKKEGYSKKQFYREAIKLYNDVNILLANGDKALLRKLVTENMFSTLKNDLKRRESIWSSVYWELVEPVVSIRTLRARLIGVDKNDLGKSFIQLTIEFLAKQKFEAYDSNGSVIHGDKTKEGLCSNRWSSDSQSPSFVEHICSPHPLHLEQDSDFIEQPLPCPPIIKDGLILPPDPLHFHLVEVEASHQHQLRPFVGNMFLGVMTSCSNMGSSRGAPLFFLIGLPSSTCMNWHGSIWEEMDKFYKWYARWNFPSISQGGEGGKIGKEGYLYLGK